jgi:hypothetical protein
MDVRAPEGSDPVRVLKIVSAAFAAAAVLGGCGGDEGAKERPAVSGDQAAILGTVDALQAASRRGDAAEICSKLFAKSLVRSIERASNQSCRQEVSQTLTSADAQLSVERQINVKGTRATATVLEKGGRASTVRFVKVGGRWRIERIEPTGSR